LTGRALQYDTNTKAREGLQTQIRDENKRAQGLIDEKAIQRSKDRVADLEKQIKALDVTTGKAEFDEAWQKHNESIAQVGHELEAAEKELKDANNEIRTIDKTLEGLKVTTTAEEFNKLKTALKAAGVEGAEAATDIEQLKDMVRKLDNEALKRVDDNLAAATAQV
jgi:chromosome segregation ATPase